MAEDNRLHVVIDGDASELQKAFRQITKSFQDTQKEADSLGKAVDSSFCSARDSANALVGTVDALKGKIAGLMSAAGATALVKKIYDVRSYFQDIESSMEVFLGSAQKANEFTEELKDYAYYNMFEFKDLVSASQQLIAYGNSAEDVIPIIHKLSEVATATKSPLEEFVAMYNRAKNLGVVDSQAMQSWATHGLVIKNVLKEIGEEASGTSVSFEQLDKVLNYVTQDGQMFGGIMDKMMPNLSSSWGQLQDNLASMFNEIGESLQEPIRKAIDAAGNLVDNYEKVGKVLVGLVTTIGVYKTALVAVRAIEKAQAVYKNVQAYIALSKQLGAATVNQVLFNKAAMANVYIAIASAIIGVVAALASFNKKQKELIKTQGEAAKTIDQETKSLDALYDAATKETFSKEKREDAISTLNTKYGDYLDSLGIEKVSVDNLASAYGQLKDAIRDKYLEQLKSQTVGERQSELDDAESTLFGLNATYIKKGAGNGYNAGRLEAEVQSFIREHPLFEVAPLEASIERIYGKYGVKLSGREQAKLYGAIYNYREAQNGLKQAEKQFDAFAAGYKSVGASAEASAEIQKTSLSDVIKKINETKAEMESLRSSIKKDGYTDEDEKRLQVLQSDLEAYQKRYKSLTGIDLSKSGSQQTKSLELAGGRSQLDEKYRNAIKAQELAEVQVRIDAMEEGSKKELAQLDHDHDARMVAIRKQYQQRLDEIEKLQKQEYKATHKGSLVGFKFNGKDPLAKQALKEANAALKNEDATYENNIDDLITRSREKFSAYLKEYGSFQEKRLAIADEYAKKIAKAQNAGNVYEAASLGQQLDRELAKVDADELMNKIDMSSVFSDLGLVLTAPLKETVKQLEDFTQTEKFKNLDVEQQKQFFEAIANAERQLGGLQGLNYREIGSAVQQYNNALVEQALYQRKLAEASKTLAKSQDELEEAIESTNQASIAEATKKNNSAVANYNSILNKYNDATANVARTQSNATTALRKFNNSVETLESGIRRLYNGELGGLFDLLGPEFANRLGMIVSGGAAIQKQANAFIEVLAKNGETLEQFAKRASDTFAKLFSGFTGSEEDATKTGQKFLSDILGDNAGKQLSKSLGKQVSDIITEAVANPDNADAWEKASAAIGDLFDKIAEGGESSGNIWGIIIGLVLQLLDEFKENGIGNFINTLLANIGDAINGILKNFWYDLSEIIADGIAALLGGVVKGLANFLTGGMFKDEIDNWGNHGITDKEIDDLVKANDALKKAIDELKSTILKSESTNKDAQTEYKRSKEMYDENLANTRRLMVETASAWSNGFLGIGGKHSSKHYINSDVSNSSWDAISKVVGRSVRDADAFFNLTAEEMKKVSLYATSAYGEVLAAADAGYKGAAQYIEQYAALAGQLEELQFSLYEKLTGVSWDSFYSSFKSMLKDMSSDAEEFAEEFEDYMNDAILESLANEKYRDRMKALYKKFAEAMSDESEGGSTLTEAEIAALRKEREAIVNDALAEREALIKSGLLTNSAEEEEREGATKSAVGASQDSVDESNARLTTIQGHTYQLNENVKAVRVQYQMLIGITGSILNHVMGIHSDTTKLNEKTDVIGTMVSSLRSDVGKIVTNGVILKR